MSRGLLIAGGVLGGGALLALAVRSSAGAGTVAPSVILHSPTEAEEIADWRQKMGLPPNDAPVAAPVAALVAAPVAVPTPALPTAPVAASTPRQRIVLCFGDSLSTGNPPYYKRIKLPGNGLVDGAGFGGNAINQIMNAPASTSKGKPGAVAIMKKVNPTEVVLLAGVNDVANHMVAKRTVGQAVERIQKDLLKAWSQIRDASARVWAVKLTPWFGYPNYFGPKASRPNDFRETTLRVNAWMDQIRGQPGGPDRVIDTRELGDEQYRLKKEYSSGGLHMSGAGQKELARIIERALAAGI